MFRTSLSHDGFFNSSGIETKRICKGVMSRLFGDK